MFRTRIICCLLLTGLLLTGCGKAAETLKKPTPQPPLPQNGAPIQVDARQAKQAETLALKVTGVQSARAVAIDRELTVAIKVTGFDRLRLQSIKQETANRIKKAIPGRQLRVTSDKKLFTHLTALQNQLQAPNPDLRQAKRELMRINEEM